MKKYPAGTKFNPWKLRKEPNGKWYIKRWVRRPDGTGATDRYPAKKYAHIRDNPLELKQLVIRLNNDLPVEERTKKAVELKHAFISPALLDKYKEYLLAQIPSKEKAQAYYYWTYTYFLMYFIGEKNLPNPLQWHMIHETDWANYLTSDRVPAAESTKKEIVIAANKFMAWLHTQRPSEVPPLKFKPLTKAKIKKIKAERELKGQTRKRTNIKLADLENIISEAGFFLRPYIMLGLHFGLRRAEVLGVQIEDVMKTKLLVKRQLVEPGPPPKVDVLKGRDSRHIDYWYAGPRETYEWVKHVSSNLIHPDTLTHLWNDHMDSLYLNYDFHDLRHTFITKAVRDYNHRDVQLAAGHKDIRTTLAYAHDDREGDDEPWSPDQAS